jgi:hypothetical protein
MTYFFIIFLQVRFDFEVFELNSDGSGGSCTYDSMAILDSPESPGGRICGTKSGYATIARVPRDKGGQISKVLFPKKCMKPLTIEYSLYSKRFKNVGSL